MHYNHYMNKLYKVLLIASLFAIIVPISIPVFAESESETSFPNNVERKQERMEKLNEKKEDFAEKREERKTERCEQITNSMDRRISNYENSKTQHITRYKNVKERLTNLINRLDKKDYDTTTLKEKLNVLDEKIKNAEGIYVNFIAKLKEARDVECGNSQGIFLEKMKEAKEVLVQFRAAIADIRNYIKSEIKPELEKVKEFLKESRKDLRDETEESSN